MSATSRSIVPSLSDTPSLPPRTQTLLCLFPGAKQVQTEGTGAEGVVRRRAERNLWDGGIEGQKEGDGRDSDLHRLMKREERLFLPDRMHVCLGKEERKRAGGSLLVCTCFM